MSEPTKAPHTSLRLVTLTGARLVRSMLRLRALVAKPGTGMDRFLDKVEKKPACAKHVRATIATFNGRDVGCGLICHPRVFELPYALDIQGYDLMIHVRAQFRRSGIGRAIVERLLETAEKDEPRPRTWRGTEDAGLFWRTFGERVR